MKKPNIRFQVEAHVGEIVYSPVRLCELITMVGLQGPADYSIRKYALKHKLGVTPEELGIHCNDPAQRRTYFIKSSNLTRLIDGLGLPVTAEQLEARGGY